jgi:hypothetical protein
MVAGADEDAAFLRQAANVADSAAIWTAPGSDDCASM